MQFAHLSPWLRVLSFACLLTSLSFRSVAQERVYPFELIGREQGADLLQANRVTQDSDGFIWFGTSSPAVKYDGYQFIREETLRDTTDAFSAYVSDIREIEPGILWMGAYEGVKVYDKTTRTVQRYVHDPGDPTSIRPGRVREIFQDSRGRIWLSMTAGLDRFDGWDGFQHFEPSDWPAEHRAPTVFHKMAEDDSGNLWAATDAGPVRIDPATRTFSPALPNFFVSMYSLHSGRDGTLWLGCAVEGLWKWDGSILEKFRLTESYVRSDVRDITEDRAGNLWVGVSRVGLFKIDPSGKHRTLRFTHDPADPFSLISTRINDLFFDRQDNLWICTVKGVNRINLAHAKFSHFRHFPGWYHDRNSIYGSIFQDSQGGIWYDNAQNGYSYSTGLGERATLFPIPDGTCCSDANIRFWAEYNDSLWVKCDDQGLCALDRRTKVFRPIHLGDSLTGDAIRFFANDPARSHLIWFATQFGLYKYNARTRRGGWFYPQADLPNLIDNSLSQFYPAKSGNRFYAHSRGRHGVEILYFDLASETFHAVPDVGYRHHLSRRGLTVASIHATSDRRIWLGTRGGVIEIDLTADTAYLHNRTGWLPEDIVVSLTSDQEGNLLVVTPRYITQYATAERRLLGSYYVAHFTGQLMSLFYVPTTWTADGEVVVPGTNGIIAFRPEQLGKDTTQPNLVLTDFRVLNRSQSFDRAIERVRNIDIDHRARSFTFEFAAIHYAAPGQNRYAYRLEGWDEDWIESGHDRSATYTNLPPRTYTFRARGANADGVWNDPERDLVIELTIHPAWHQTWWARTLGILAVLGLSWRGYRYHLNRTLVKAEAERLKELDDLKTRLYTNITHEFRTPLTVILGMAEKIAANPREWLAQGIDMITRNGQNLLRLVNQLLDLAKLDAGQLSVQQVRMDVIPFLRYHLESFHSLAATKKIGLHSYSAVEALEMDVDPDKVRQIVANLLSNAIKFTEPEGSVWLYIDVVDKQLQLILRDTGVGIPATQLPHIFDRFYQVDGTHTRPGEGTGIGLALTRELVHLLGGSIRVESRVGQGTAFTVQLPITRRESPAQPSERPQREASPRPTATALAPVAPRADGERRKADLPKLLLVEDNADVVAYIQSCLQDQYALDVTSDGRESLDRAIATVPDLIISDVMMPEMDGFELCATLKNDQRTSHIPVILLTAKGDQASRNEGLQGGADAYLIKPFNEAELRIRIDRLLALRRALRVYYGQSAPGQSPPARPATGSTLDDAFLDKITTFVTDHLADADLDVGQLYTVCHMSRTQLHRKLTALTGLSATKFINRIRLERAATLLFTTDLSIKEIAYQTGFNSPDYFGRLFSAAYGDSPSQYRRKLVE